MPVLKLLLWTVLLPNLKNSFTKASDVLVSVSVPQFMAMPLCDGRGHFKCYCMIINGHDFAIKWQWQDF